MKGGVRIKKTGKTIKILSLFVGMSELSCNFATNISRYSIVHREQPMVQRKLP